VNANALHVKELIKIKKINAVKNVYTGKNIMHICGANSET